MPGAKIGHNVIIGAGAVVRGKVPSNSIFIGNPAIKISDLDKKAAVWSNIETNIKKDWIYLLIVQHSKKEVHYKLVIRLYMN